MNKFAIAIIFLVAAFSVDAYAVCVQNGNQVVMVGLDSPDGTVYVDLSTNDKKCGCTMAHFKPQNTKIDMALSILMAAKISGTRVRIDWAEANACSGAYRVYLQ